jgi:copper chaperone NosL
MKKFLVLIGAAWVLAACSVKPEPLAYGKDPCQTCKMTLVDGKFGAEILTRKGKVYKFDDVNCMMEFFRSGYVPEENIEQLLVVDFGNPGTLIDARTAHYIKADAIRSPMASQVAAFSSGETLADHNKTWNERPMTWADLSKVLK